jgi:hypothetical protein
MTRTGSCFVIKEYRKASYKKVVEKIAAIVSYSERSSVTDKIRDFIINGPPTKYSFIPYISPLHKVSAIFMYYSVRLVLFANALTISYKL